MTSLHNRLTITAALAAVLSLTLSACQRGGDEAAGPVGSSGTQTAPDKGSAGGTGMGSGTQSPSPGGTEPIGGSGATSSPGAPATAASSPRTP